MKISDQKVSEILHRHSRGLFQDYLGEILQKYFK